jgi:hypothetical protein
MCGLGIQRPLIARLGLQRLRRVCPLCPSISDLDLLSNCESMVDLDPEVANRALDLGMPKQQLNGS